MKNNILYDYRRLHGKTYRKLAAEISAALGHSISHQTISNWEKGISPPNPDKLRLLAIFGSPELKQLANDLLSMYTA